MQYDVEEWVEFASRHKDYREELGEEVLHQDKNLVLSVSTPAAREIYNMRRQVMFIYDKTRSFTRLKVSKKGVLFCEIEPEHFVEDLVVKFFAKRFPLFVIVIGSHRGTFICENLKIYETKERTEQVLKRLEDALPENPLLKDFNLFEQDLWETFYYSQYIKDRKNKKYFLRGVPKRFQDVKDVTPIDQEQQRLMV